MLVLLRMLPFLCAAAVGGSFWVAFAFPRLALWAFAAALVLVMWMMAKLVDLPRGEFPFWNFLLTVTVFASSSFLTFLFLEQRAEQVALSVLTTLLVLAFTEHVFLFFHQQARYRILSLERISLLIHLCAHFLLAGSLYAFLLLVHTPLWLLALAYVILAFFFTSSMLWVSKVDRARAFPYAVSGAIVLTEFFVALSFLPSGHGTNAGILTVFLYVFFGLSRSQFMGMLTRSTFLRYLAAGLGLLFPILLSSRWV